jgi:hypothetical protein
VSSLVTVLIGSPDLLDALKQRASSIPGDLLAFSDADALQALDAIVRRSPAVVALERLFAASPRGAALINRIKSDPTLASTEIRVVTHDSDSMRVLVRRANGSSDVGHPITAGGASGAQAGAAVATPASPAQPLDQRGTRRAPRIRIAGLVPVLVDGNQASLVDLSVLGAQVISANVLKPNQRVRIALSDESGTVRFNAAVAWASFEIPNASGPRYRAGIEFIDADAGAVGAYCERHKS